MHVDSDVPTTEADDGTEVELTPIREACLVLAQTGDELMQKGEGPAAIAIQAQMIMGAAIAQELEGLRTILGVDSFFGSLADKAPGDEALTDAE